MRLDQKVALITGAARGMGAVEAKLFAGEGARVIATDVSESGAEVVDQIRKAGGEATFLQHDVTERSDWDSVVGAALDSYGRLDILVNNAALHGGRSTFEDTPMETWRSVTEVNVLGVFLGIQAVVPALERGGGGSIVNISSVSGSVAMVYPKRDTTPTVAYHASKASVTIMTKYAAAQFGERNIRVNSVHPGPIASPMGADSVRDPARLKHFTDVIPLGRFGEPEDIAQGVLYLASDESKFVTGTSLVIDGGYTCRV